MATRYKLLHEGNITTVSAVPFVAAGGTANALTANFSPDITLVDGLLIKVRASAANTVTNPSIAVDGGSALTIYKKGNQALVAGDIYGADHILELVYKSATTRWELLNPASTGMSNPMTTAGDLIYGGTSGVPTRLAIGTAGYYLKVNTGATAPEWAAVSSGSFVYLGSATVSGNYIPVTSLFDNTNYHGYRIIAPYIRLIDGLDFEVQFSINNGSSWLSSGYLGRHYITKTTPANNTSSTSTGTLQGALGGGGGITNSSMDMIIYPYAAMSSAIYQINNAYDSSQTFGGVRNTNATAIDAVRFTNGAGVYAIAGTVYVYGIKKS